MTKPRTAKPEHSVSYSFQIEPAAVMLTALGNPKRLEIVKRLVADEWSVTHLAGEVGLTQSALSQHLQLLRKAGVVESRRDAQMIFYRSRSEKVRQILDALQAIASSETNRR